MRAARSLSLELKLPLFITAIIALVVVALALLAMREVRLGAEGRAEARLLDVSDQFATASSAATERRIAAFAAVSRRPEIIAAALRPTPAAMEAAGPALALLPADSTVLGTSLRDARDSVVLSRGDSTVLRGLVPLGAGDTAAGAGPFVRQGDTVAYAISMPVKDGSRSVGRLVQWRRVMLTEQGREAFSRFIGSEAQLYFGNSGNGMWIDMSGRAVDIPRDTVIGRVVRRSHDGRQWLSVIRPLAGTPWLMAIEIPESFVMAQPRAFLRRFAIVSLLLLALGGLLAVLMSRTITAPLKELTVAAERVAAGDYSQPALDEVGEDEIGRLARAFRVMTLRVQDTHRQLEADVADRQQEVRDTYKKLEAVLESGESRSQVRGER